MWLAGKSSINGELGNEIVNGRYPIAMFDWRMVMRVSFLSLSDRFKCGIFQRPKKGWLTEA
jgi:hypothetical protein